MPRPDPSQEPARPAAAPDQRGGDAEHAPPTGAAGRILRSALIPVLAAAVVIRWWVEAEIGSELTRWASASLLLAYVALALASCSLALIDLHSFRLPNRIVLPGIAAFAALTSVAALLGPVPLARTLVGGGALGLCYGALRMIPGSNLGMGDVKLAVLLGMALAQLGWIPLLVGGLLPFPAAGMFCLLQLAAGRIRLRGSVAFGPWMLLGAWTGILASPILA